MNTVSNDRLIYSFAGRHAPALTVDSGEKVTLVTRDCYSDLLSHSDQDWLAMQDIPAGPNPATGPVYVRDAQPGDTLKVTVERIELPAFGMMNIRPGVGAMGHVVSGQLTRRIEIRNNSIEICGAVLPLDPMVGVIGVAPAGAEIDTATPGRHGGNLDTRHIREGATLYFPVAVEGALFAAGDVHAAMGDGEVAICGLETASRLTCRLEVIKDRTEEWPVLYANDRAYVLCSADTLDEAALLARDALLAFLKKRVRATTEELVLLMSLAADLEISQIVDPLVTVRMGIRQGGKYPFV